MFKSQKKKKSLTRVIVQFDAGFPNSLFLRGEGAPGLSWEKGVELKNLKPDEWVWECEAPFSAGEFKVLINDQIFELGENHQLQPESTVRINPKFP